MNEEVGMKNRVTVGEGGERIVRPFRRQEFWKFIGCILSEVTYEKKGHKICSEIPKYFGNKSTNQLQRYVLDKNS